MIYEKSDVILFVIGAGKPYHPYMVVKPMLHMPVEFAIACPLPSKRSSFFNIITPFTLVVWALVLATLLWASCGGIVVNQVYKTMPGRTSKWSW